MIHEDGDTEYDRRFREEYAEQKRWSWYATVGILLILAELTPLVLTWVFPDAINEPRLTVVRSLLLAGISAALAGVLYCVTRQSTHEAAMAKLLPNCTVGPKRALDLRPSEEKRRESEATDE